MVALGGENVNLNAVERERAGRLARAVNTGIAFGNRYAEMGVTLSRAASAMLGALRK